MPSYTKLYLLFFLLLFYLSSQAQHWKSLEQKPLGVRYEVPREWYVGGVMKEQACHCYSGTLNSSFRGHINMVLLERSDSSDIAIKQQEIWGYTFAETAPQQSIANKNFIFEQTISTWREDTTLQVIRLHTKTKNQHYLLYFWGAPQDLENQNTIIQRIIHSIEPANQ